MVHELVPLCRPARRCIFVSCVAFRTTCLFIGFLLVGMRCIASEMPREERPDAVSCVSRVLVFVTSPYDDTEHPDQALAFVEAGLSGVRRCLEVMVDFVPLESAFRW